MELDSTYAMVNENAYRLMFNNEIPPSLFFDPEGFETEDLVECGISVPEGFYDSSDAQYDAINIELSWNVIHFLLTGKDRHKQTFPSPANTPFDNMIFGAEEVEDCLCFVKNGFLNKSQVKECYEAISDISKEDLLRRYNVGEMVKNHVIPVDEQNYENIRLMKENQEYPTDNGGYGEKFFDYVFSHFLALRAFFKKASDEQKCITIYINW